MTNFGAKLGIIRAAIGLTLILSSAACNNVERVADEEQIDVTYCFTDRGDLDYDAPVVLHACNLLLSRGDQLTSDERFEGFYARGLTKRELADLDGSEADLRTALELEPDRDDVVRMLAWTLREKGDLEGALILYNRAIEMMPDDWQGYLSRCVVLGAGLGRYDEAVADCQKAIALDFISDDTVFFTSNALNKVGSHQGAIDLIEQHSDKEFTSERVYEEYIIALIRVEQTDKAWRALHAAIDEHPESARFRRLESELKKTDDD